MNLPSSFGRAVLAAFFSFAAFAAASAQDWPSRNITVSCRSAPAARPTSSRGRDGSGRPAARPDLRDREPPGAGGTIGASMVAKSAPDGYTILAYGALATANALYTKLPYDTLNDFIPVIPFGNQPLVVSLARQGLQDARRPGRRRQGKARRIELFHRRRRFGVAFRRRAAARERRLPGAAHSVQGRRRSGDRGVAGRIRLQPALPATTFPLINDGKLVALAVSATSASACARSADHHRGRAVGQSVYPFYSGLFLPAKTPREIVEKLTRKSPKRCKRRRCRRGSLRSASSRCR